MRRFKTTVTLALVVAFLLAGFVWSAQGDAASQPKKQRHYVRPGVGPDAALRHGPHMRMMAAYLQLSKDQIAKIQQILDRSRNDTRDLRYDLLQKRIEMHKSFTDPKANNQTLTAKARELSGLRQRQMDRNMQAIIEVRSILTPEQIQKLDRMPMMGGAMGCGVMMSGPMMGPIGGGPGMMGSGMDDPDDPMMMSDAAMAGDMMQPGVTPYAGIPPADIAVPDEQEEQ